MSLFIKNVYTILLQKNPKLKLTDGYTTFVERLSTEQVAGIFCMAACIFGNNVGLHLTIESTNVGDEREEEIEEENLVQLSHYDALDEFLLTYVPFFIPYDPEIYTWYEYILFVSSFSPVKKFTEDPNENIKTYTCRIKTPFSTNIFHFDTSGFLEGAIKLCTWLNYNYKDFIDLVYIGTSPLSIFPR